MVGEMEVGDTGQVYVVDSLGYIIAHRDTSLVLNKINVNKRKAVSKVITEKTTVLGLDEEEEYFNEQGVKVYVVGLPLSRTGWGVFVEEPIKDAWASYKKIRATGLLLGFVTLILLLILMINAKVLNVLFVDLRKGRELLTAEVKKRTSELNELDKTTKLLVKRDLELSVTNRELDKKIEQLEKSEKSLLRAFGDIRTAQKELEEEKDKTEAVINNFIDPIIVLDEAKKIILFNPASRRIFGLTDESLGKEVQDKDNFSMQNFKEIIDKDFKVKTLEDIESENVTIEEVEVKFGDHDITYKVITARVLSDREEYLGIMKIFYDVTREKTLDKLKSEFISIAAHQLRTPLSAIKWVMKMVLDEDVGKLNKEQTELMEKGYKSNERIIRLVNDLLNVSRIEEGRFGYTFEKQDFNKAIGAVIEWSESSIAKGKIKFKVNKPKKLPPVVYDKEKMNLVLQNLLDNAIKYTPEYGTIEINIEVAGKFLRVAVKDNGVGIPEKDKQKLFSKFFRAANVVRLQTEGSGLGLFIVKNIIEKHGGTISVDSKEGEGTEVSFKIPLTA
jgi:PAS domain S-box-containing protein